MQSNFIYLSIARRLLISRLQTAMLAYRGLSEKSTLLTHEPKRLIGSVAYLSKDMLFPLVSVNELLWFMKNVKGKTYVSFD